MTSVQALRATQFLSAWGSVGVEYGLKVVKSCSLGNYLFTYSETFAVGL